MKKRLLILMMFLVAIATGSVADVHTHIAGDVTLENKEDPTCTTDGHYDEVVYCTICGEEMSRNTQYIPALGHDLTHVPEVPATTTAEGMKEHYTCSRCTDLLDMNYATVTASDLVIPKLVKPMAYAALSDDNKTLTFYYDGQKASRNGMSVGPFESNTNVGWYNQRKTITTVVFDASFADFRPTSTACWFYGCYNLTTITGIENLRTDEVTKMNSMFIECSSLRSIDLSSFNTEKVTSMGSMFYSCSSLTNLDLSSFSTANVTNMNFMFYNCSNLMRIAVSPEKWNTSKAGDSSYTFTYCTRLVGGNGTAYDSSHTNVAYAVVDKDGTPGYLTDANVPVEPEAYAVLSGDGKTLTFYYDMEKASRGGISVGPFKSTSDRKWGWDSNCGAITTVVFDASFANYKPTSTAYWFCYFKNLTTITGIENLKTDEVTDMRYMFSLCKSLPSLDLRGFNTANVTDMSGMFSMEIGEYSYEEPVITSIDVSSFNTAKVTNMYKMFEDCIGLTSLDVSGFNTANVTDMYAMFRGCSSLTSLDLSGFNTEKVTRMSSMFANCYSLTSLDLSSFNTANVTWMEYMFYMYSGSALTKIAVDPEKWNISNVMNGESMFLGCTNLVGGNGTTYVYNHINVTYAVIDKDGTPGYLTDVKDLTVPKAYAALSSDDKTLTFYYDFDKASRNGMSVGPFEYSSSRGWDNYCRSITTVVFDASFADYKPTSTAYWFCYFNNLTTITGIENLKTDEVTNMRYMFAGCSSLTSLDLSSFNTANVEGMYSMFDGCTNLKSLNLSNFNTAKVESMLRMFLNCSNLTSLDLSSFNTENVTNMDAMFGDCTSLTSLDLSSFNTEKVESMNSMFSVCSSLTSLDLSSFNTEKVGSMNFMFEGCTNLKSLNLSNFNTANVTSMGYMFYNCSNLTSLDLSNFNTEKVENMYGMFELCSSLTSLDLSSFNTAKVETMGYMFADCTSLTSLNLSNFNTTNVKYIYGFVKGCSGLTSLDLSSFNTANVQFTDNMLSGCTALTKITVDPDKWNMSKVGYSYRMFFDCTSLVGGNGTVYDENHTDVAYAVIDKDSTPGYLTDVNVPVEPEAYAVLSDGYKTLTFYYDMEKASRGGMSVGPFDGNETVPAWSDKASGIRNANIDESFAGYTALTSTAYWFEGCSEIKAVSGLENLVMDNVTDMSSMFKGCNNLRSVSLSGMNTGKVTNMHGLFWDCNALQTIDLSTLDTRSVADMSGMFNYCNSLKTVDLSGVNTASVTDMNNMFYYCSSLTDLDLSSFNTASVTNMRYMFEGCSSLTKITVSETGWTTKAVNSGTAMFSGCRDIVGGNGTTYDAGHTDEGYARIDKAGTPGYLTSSAGTGINLLKTTPGGDGYFYTPDGRRIEGQPTKQGFYITNGRKVMAK